MRNAKKCIRTLQPKAAVSSSWSTRATVEMQHNRLFGYREDKRKIKRKLGCDMHAIRSVDFFSFTFPTISRQTGRTLEVVSDRKISFCNIRFKSAECKRNRNFITQKTKQKKTKRLHTTKETTLRKKPQSTRWIYISVFTGNSERIAEVKELQKK